MRICNVPHGISKGGFEEIVPTLFMPTIAEMHFEIKYDRGRNLLSNVVGWG